MWHNLWCKLDFYYRQNYSGLHYCGLVSPHPLCQFFFTRKSENPEKTHDFREVHILHELSSSQLEEFLLRIKQATLEVKGKCSNYFATEAPNMRVYIDHFRVRVYDEYMSIYIANECSELANALFLYCFACNYKGRNHAQSSLEQVNIESTRPTHRWPMHNKRQITPSPLTLPSGICGDLTGINNSFLSLIN